MCSGKEQLKRNLHRSSKGAPKRKEKMKKTIAILLVLVIGMVGVFAATVGTKDLLLTTTVSPIDSMAIVAADATAPTFPVTGDQFTTFTGTPVDLTVDNTTSAQTVGKLYTYSNRRVYEVQITATPLSSTAGGSTNYIDYVVSGGVDAAAQATTFTTNGASTSTTAVVFYTKSGASAGATVGANGQSISVQLTTDYTTVAAGAYSGAITFNYIAN